MFCKNCGKKLNADEKFCSACGTPASNFEQNQQQTGYGYQYQSQNRYQNDVQYSSKSRIAAGLLGIFLGGLGIHNFYLGFTSKGVIQLILTICTCGLAQIWGFIEGILILAKSSGYNKDAEGKILSD